MKRKVVSVVRITTTLDLMLECGHVQVTTVQKDSGKIPETYECLICKYGEDH